MAVSVAYPLAIAVRIRLQTKSGHAEPDSRPNAIHPTFPTPAILIEKSELGYFAKIRAQILEPKWYRTLSDPALARICTQWPTLPPYVSPCALTSHTGTLCSNERAQSTTCLPPTLLFKTTKLLCLVGVWVLLKTAESPSIRLCPTTECGARLGFDPQKTIKFWGIFMESHSIRLCPTNE